jgi:heat shock protein HtpX
VLLLTAAAVGVPVGIVALLLGAGPLAVVPAVVAGAAAAAWLWHDAEGRALRALGARTATERDEARLHNLVEGLCARAGLPKPGLHVVDDRGVDAAALGRDARRSSVVVTRGLLDALDRVELEGLLALELALIRRHETRLPTLAVGLGRLGPAIVGLAIGPGDRDAPADAAGVALTRYPPGLLHALEKVAASPSAAAGSRPAGHLWLSAARPHAPSLDERIAALREL